WAGKRFPASELLPYIVAQVLGAIAAAGTLYLIASGKDGGLSLAGSNPLATNGFGAHSPGGYSLLSCFLIEVLLTFGFLLIILGATDRRAAQGLAPVAIGLGLTLIHLISIPVTNTSVNPARSTGPALFAGVELFSQVWLFWLAPILGAVLAGFVYSSIFDESPMSPIHEAEPYREPV
ncbi:MAG: aquaporin, partial [Cyanobacteria bacterium CAN_BIN43]|nr:aquaporin [Cyanobacteria bacterium CAN_BIN43]